MTIPPFLPIYTVKSPYEDMEPADLRKKLDKIEQLARRHASPASNPGAHALAAAIVRICEEK